jgi:nuclear pore complex protein Nup62
MLSRFLVGVSILVLSVLFASYMLATDLYSHLDDLSGSLTQMIEAVNELSSVRDASSSGDDPMSQIALILNSHLESLQWIDSSVRELETKVTDVEKRVKEAGVSVNGGIGASINQSKSRSFGLAR